MNFTEKILKRFCFVTSIKKNTFLLHCTLLLFILSHFNSFSQTQDSRIASTKLPVEEVELVNMPALNNEALLEAELQRRGPGLAPRFAETIEVDITPETYGHWETRNGIATWRLRIRSEDAYSLNLGFTKYIMPDDGQLIIYSPDYKHVMGPFTPSDNEEHEQLWTPIFDGDELVIEVSLPEANRSALQLQLNNVNHDYIGFSNMTMLSGSCNLDVICGAADGWEIVDQYRDIIQSVAVIGLNGGTFCTGFLVNNTRNDCTPYFMTANHCGITNNNAASLVAYWNFENSTCREPGSPESGAGGNGVLNDFNTGSIFRASYAPSDFTLVELDDEVSETADAFFAGWSREEVAPADTVICVHHPSTDEKRISFEFNPTYVGSGTSSAPSPNGDHIVVPDWDIGTTEGGSSGSPLFNNEKQVVGQLHAGAAACGNDAFDTYGWFFTSWEGGGTPSTRLKDWLDTDNVGLISIDGKSQETCSFFVGADPQEVEICAPDQAVYQLEVSGNFLSDVTLSLSGSPAGANSNFSTNPVAPGGVSNLTISNTGNIAAGSYTMTVDATDGTESVSTTVTLVVSEGIPALVTLQNPTNGAIDIITLPTLEWQAVGGDVSYEIEVAQDENFTNIISSGTNLTANTFQTTSLTGNTTYYWRVRATNNCGTSDWSEIFSFSTGNISCSPTSAEDVPQTISTSGTPSLTSTIEINTGGNVAEIRVLNIDISHSYVGDLQVELTSPSGTTISLFNRPGFPGSTFGCDGDNLLVSFEDGAPNSADAFESTCNNAPAIEGTYQPIQPLSLFAGEPADGIWTLTISDNIDADGGTFNGWELDLCSVAVEDISITPDATEFESCVNEDIEFTLTLGSGFSNAGVELSASGNPAGSTVTFNPNPANPGSTVDVVISNITTEGSFTITLNGTDGLNASDTEIQLNVLGLPETTTLQIPLNGATNVSINPVLIWENTSATSFFVEIATDMAFNNIVVAESLGAVNTYTAPGLEVESIYFWRVRGDNECGVGTFSSTFSFTTSNEDCTPLIATDVPLTISENGISTVTSSIEVTANGIVSFIRVLDVDISHTFSGDITAILTSPSGTSIVLFDQIGVPEDDFGCEGDNLMLNFDDSAVNTADDLENTCANLPAAEGFFQPIESLADLQGEFITGAWTLSIIDNADQDGGSLNGWALELCASTPDDFSLNPSATNFEACTNETLSFEMTVGTAFDNSGVSLSANGNPPGSNVSFSQNPANPGATVTVTITNITQSGNFSMILTGDDGTNTADATIELVVSASPASFSLLSPLDGATGLPLGNLLTWDASEAAENYQLLLATDPSFTNIVLDEMTDLTSFNVNDLDFSTTYYWMVIAMNACGASEDNETFSFTTISDLTFDANPSAREACQVQSPGFSLTISEGYNDPVSISYTVTPNEPINIDFSIDQNNVPPGSTVVAMLTNLITIPEGNYTITFQIDDGTNMDLASVSLSLGAAPTITNMLNPLNGSTIMETSPTLDWETVDNATEYLVEIATDDAFITIVESETVMGTSYTMNSSLNSGIYYWRVTATNNCGAATPQPFNFTVQTNSTNELSGRTISLQPNPTEDLVSVVFSKPLSGALGISVFSINGQQLDSFELNLPSTAVDVDFSAYPAGIYLLRLVNQESSLVKRIVVQR